jgi:phage terminase large subunit-like protein
MVAAKSPRKRRTPVKKPRTPSKPSRLAKAKLAFVEQGADWKTWVRNGNDERAAFEGCVPDVLEADKKVAFFEEVLVLTKDGPVRPFKLAPFQEHAIIRPLFGWKRADGRRRFTHASIWMPQGNGKTTLAAGITAVLLLADGQRRAKIYSAANDRDQAAYIFDELAMMATCSPILKNRLSIWKSTKTIVYNEVLNRYKAISADAASAEGKAPHGLVIDEIHAFNDAGRRLFEALKFTMTKCFNSLWVTISTAGRAMEGIGWEEYQKARSVWAGQNEESWWKFVFIAEAAVEDDWTDPKVWKSSNPAMGVTITMDRMKEDFLEASQSPHDELIFRQRRLNQWTSISEDFIPAKAWDKCGRDLTLDDLKGKRCWAGLDLSSVSDTSCLCLVFKLEADLPFVWPFFWIPRYDKVNRPRSDIAEFIAWGHAGHIEVVESNVIDYAAIRAKINVLRTEFGVEGVAADPMFAGQLLQELEDDDRIPSYEHKQNFTQMTEPCLDYQRRCVSQRLAHGRHPVLDNQMSHVTLKNGQGDTVMPKRDKSRWRIDGPVAAIMALNMFIKFKDKPKPRGGMTRGVVWV